MTLPHAHSLYVHGTTVAHRTDARFKIITLLAFAVIVAATPRSALAIMAGEAAVVTIVILASSLPLRLMASRVAVEAPFVAFTVFLPFFAEGPRVDLGPLTLSTAGCWAAWGVLAKSTLCCSAAIVLTATTTVPDLLLGLVRLRVPTVIVAISGLMLRYVDVIGMEWSRMRRSMAARGYHPRSVTDAQPLANGVGALFVRAHERGERVYGAMLARGFSEARP